LTRIVIRMQPVSTSKSRPGRVVGAIRCVIQPTGQRSRTADLRGGRCATEPSDANAD
jgi:hypothetical protein